MSEFEKIGLDPKAAAKVKGEIAESLTQIIQEANVGGGCDKGIGALLHLTASRFPTTKFPPHVSARPKFLTYITSGKISSVLQFDEGTKFLATLGRDHEIDWSKFEEAAGVGISYTKEQIDAAADSALKECDGQIKELRYRVNIGLLLSKAMPYVKFANGQEVKARIEEKLAALLGPRTAEDDAPLQKKKEKKPAADKDAGKKDKKEASSSKDELKGASKKFPLPHENNKRNSKPILDRHLATTGGRVVTRFPPEPNGFLHIGHAKAINQNFGYARKHGGVCILRYDDTNPEKEEISYYDSIRRNVEWLTGHPPAAVTFSADYFDELYQLAIKLIKRGKAFVCHQTSAQMKESRDKREPSPWRDRPIEENLRLFEEMRRGKYAEGEISLRMKQDYKSNNPCMWDHVAYRVKHHPHVQTGDKWCIYPSYDFTHCIVDSLENITHSMCTLEFLPRQESYFWLLEALDMFQPVVWEYSRLAITNNVLSKRKLLYLVKTGTVCGWDDPRLFTLDGLKRRGYSANAINNLCELVGVTTKDSSMIEMSQLEACARADLDENAPRAWAVSEPLKVKIKNFAASFGGAATHVVEIPNHPKYPERGNHTQACCDEIYIDACDFRLEDSNDYFGLAPNKEVGLKGLGNFLCTDVDRDPSTGRVLCLHGTLDVERKNKPKGHLQWVSAAPGKSAHKIELRLYEKLFMSKDPTELGDAWLSDINPDSKVVVAGAMGDESIKALEVGGAVQLERIGFFCKDPDSTPECTVLNRTVTLRESTSKKVTKGSDKPDPRKGRPQPAADQTPLSRVSMVVGQITKVWRHPDASGLYCEHINIGEDAPREVCSGLVDHIPIEQMENRRVVVMSNLKPATMRGVKSHAMVMCATGADGKVDFVTPPPGAKIGERITFEGHPGEPDPEINPKKKILEKVLPDMAAKDGVAYYQNIPFMTSAGPCTCTVSGNIK